MYVSELIDKGWLYWRKGEAVIIDCQTGKGKTHFILNVLTKSKKRILYLYNRKSLGNQLRKQGKRIEFKSYQFLANELRAGKKVDINYDYVICDECHYMFHDGLFNNRVDYVHKAVLDNKMYKGVVIYISATMELITPVIKRNYETVYEYVVPRDYTYVTPYHFRTNDEIIKVVNNSKEKWMIFVNSIDKGLKLQNEIRGSELVSTKHNPKILEQVEDKERFNCKVLITTKVLDNGVNVKDPRVKNVVIYAHDKIDFIQMLGRVRGNQPLNLYIYRYTNRDLKFGYYRTLCKNIETISLFRDNYDEFCDRYNDNYHKLDNCIFRLNKDEKWELIENGLYLNVLKHFHMEIIVTNLEQDTDYLLNKQLSWIGHKESIDIHTLFKEYLERILSKVIGKELYKQEQDKLKESIEESIGGLTKKSRVSTLHKLIKHYGLNFSITVERNREREKNRGKLYWLITDEGTFLRRNY